MRPALPCRATPRQGNFGSETSLGVGVRAASNPQQSPTGCCYAVKTAAGVAARGGEINDRRIVQRPGARDQRASTVTYDLVDRTADDG